MFGRSCRDAEIGGCVQEIKGYRCFTSIERLLKIDSLLARRFYEPIVCKQERIRATTQSIRGTLLRQRLIYCVSAADSPVRLSEQIKNCLIRRLYSNRAEPDKRAICHALRQPHIKVPAGKRNLPLHDLHTGSERIREFVRPRSSRPHRRPAQRRRDKVPAPPAERHFR